MISLVPSEIWGFLKGGWPPKSCAAGVGLLPAAWGCGAMPRPVHLAGQRLRRRPDKCDAGCRPSGQAAYHSFPSLPPTKTRSLRCTAFFPPKPLRWVSAGALLGEVIKAPVLHFFGISACGWYHYPPAAVAVSEQPGAGFISAEKTAFSERVLCADGHAVPSCTQRFFGVPAWGWYHYPRRAIHAVETLDARGSRRLICRFYTTAVLALCGLNIPSSGTHATPAPNRAHSGSHAETRGFQGRRVDG